jgi:iron complex outermembrane recepter protein
MELRGLASTGFLCIAGVTSAQVPPAPASTARAETSVVASPLHRIDLETHTPVRVITRQELAPFHHVGLGQALQRLPFMTGSAPNLNSNAAGDGSTFADIGGLGRARCIVMLNGRRLLVNELSGEPGVDLDALPLASIERIEIFLGGASPVWGADAVAGVINVITRSDTNGLELSAATSRTTHDDGQGGRFTAFAGRVFGRGHANVSAEYRKSNPIRSSARDFSARSEALGCLDGPHCVWPFGSSATPAGFYDVVEGNELGLAPGRYTADGSGGFRPFRVVGPQNDLYSTQTDAFLRAGREGGTLAASGAYEWSDATLLSFDLLASTDRSRRQLAALPFFTTVQGGPGLITVVDTPDITPAPVPVAVFYNNYYNPFGTVVTDVRRRLVELGPRSVINSTDSVFLAGTSRYTAAVWEVESTLAFGQLRAQEHISHVLRDTLHLQDAVGPSGPDANGNIVCGEPDLETGIVTDPLEGCVPLDLFHGPGSITPEMLDYIVEPRDDAARVAQVQARVIARRPLEFPGLRQTARFAVGAESRIQPARFDIKDFDTPTTSRRGTVEQHDVMTEIAVPLGNTTDDAPFVLLTTGGRLSWFENRSLLGTTFAAAMWRPNAQLMMRSRITQVYRAPSAGELFLGRRERILPVNYPCLGPTDPDTSSCQPTDEGGPAIVGDTPYISAGNPRLRPERGYGASAGIVWDSETRDERFLALDLTWLRLDNTIRAPGALELIEACREGRSEEACTRITPVEFSNTYIIDGSLMNGGRDDSMRMDFEARTTSANKWGDWRAELFASYLLRRELVDINGDRLRLRGVFDVTQSATGVAYPSLRWQGSLQWSKAPLTAQWTMQFVGSVNEVRDRNGLLADSSGALSRRVGSAMYHDLRLSWSDHSRWSLQFNIDNLFDNSPPRVNNGFEANTDTPTYRLEGRLYSLSVNFAN